MSDPDDVVTRRAVVAMLAVTSIGCVTASASDESITERFVTFDPPVPMAPSILLLDSRGRAVVFSSRAGRTTLVALWATWCPACHWDIPLLVVAQRSLAKERIDVVLINVDAAPTTHVLAQSVDMSIGNAPLFFDPDGSRLAAPSPDGRRSPFQLFGMPILFVVDSDRRVCGYVKGSVDWTSADAIRFLQALSGA